MFPLGLGQLVRSLLVGASVVLMGAAFVIWVSAHGGDPSLVHACLNTASGEVKIVGPNDGCRPGWIAQHWPMAPAVVYYAEQTATVTTSGVSNWVDLTGADVTFTATENATLDLFANGAVTGVDGSAPWIRCAFRFVVDAVATGDPTFGDMLVSPARNESGGAEWTSFSLTRRVLVGPGQHTVGTQLARGFTSSELNNNCQVDGVPTAPFAFT